MMLAVLCRHDDDDGGDDDDGDDKVFGALPDMGTDCTAVSWNGTAIHRVTLE